MGHGTCPGSHILRAASTPEFLASPGTAVFVSASRMVRSLLCNIPERRTFSSVHCFSHCKLFLRGLLLESVSPLSLSEAGTYQAQLHPPGTLPQAGAVWRAAGGQLPEEAQGPLEGLESGAGQAAAQTTDGREPQGAVGEGRGRAVFPEAAGAGPSGAGPGGRGLPEASAVAESLQEPVLWEGGCLAMPVSA